MPHQNIFGLLSFVTVKHSEERIRVPAILDTIDAKPCNRNWIKMEVFWLTDLCGRRHESAQPRSCGFTYAVASVHTAVLSPPYNLHRLGRRWQSLLGLVYFLLAEQDQNARNTDYSTTQRNTECVKKSSLTHKTFTVRTALLLGLLLDVALSATSIHPGLWGFRVASSHTRDYWQ